MNYILMMQCRCERKPWPGPWQNICTASGWRQKCHCPLWEMSMSRLRKYFKRNHWWILHELMEEEYFHVLSNELRGSWSSQSASVVVGAVLRAIIRPRVGSVSIGSIGVTLLLFLRVVWHEVLHVHGILLLLVSPDAHRRQAEEDGGDEGETNTDPGDKVGPVILELSVLLQSLE